MKDVLSDFINLVFASDDEEEQNQVNSWKKIILFYSCLIAFIVFGSVVFR